MVICLELGADLHMAQLMPLPLTVSCFSKIQIGIAFLVLAHPGCPGKRAVKRMCVCVCTVMNCAESTVLLEPMIRYDMRCCFNVCSNADINQLNLPHGTKNLKVEKRKTKK